MTRTTRRDARIRRHQRLRRRIAGSPERPRLAVFRSNSHIYAQVIDDTRGHTLVSASTLEADLSSPGEEGKTGQASLVGRRVAERAQQAGIERVVLDRGGNAYHGRVRALADGAREGGLDL